MFTRIVANATLLASAALISWPLRAQSLTTLYSFAGGTDGAAPAASLLYQGGSLYGTTEAGGAFGEGTVFAINPATGAETLLHNFTGGNDGSSPMAAVVYASGSLYGTAATGGAANAGSVFKIGLVSGKLKVLHSFTGYNDGGNPVAPLLYQKGALYGTTLGGGTFSNDCLAASQRCGTVFEIDPNSGAQSVLYSFTNTSNNQGTADGWAPAAGLIYEEGGFWGTTSQGGFGAVGTVFVIVPGFNSDGTPYSFFGGSNGSYPQAGLSYRGGFLYGTTAGGGGSARCSGGCGTVFKMDINTSAETVVHAFAGPPDGAAPLSALIFASGAFYGTTEFGGASNQGTIFKLNPVTGKSTIIYSFSGSDGANPVAGLIDEGGILYGTTRAGGAGFGTVFKLPL